MITIYKRGIPLRLFSLWRRCLSAQTQLAVQESNVAHCTDSEYTEKPEYPKILDMSFKARKLRKTEDFHDRILSTKTVEEKLIKINMPRYYGYQVVELNDSLLPYNSLPPMQHYTRTVFEENSLDTMDEGTKLDELVQDLKNDVKDSLEFVNDYMKSKYKDTKLTPIDREKKFTQVAVEQINRSIINALCEKYPHLHELDMDYNPRIEAFWCVGGIQRTKLQAKCIRNRGWETAMAKEPTNRWMQYTGDPPLTLRHRHQLPTWKTEEESKNLAYVQEKIPIYEYDPRTLGYSTTYRHGTNIPGYWPGCSNGFGFISYHCRAHIIQRAFDLEDFKEALRVQAIQASYAWLLAQANYNGFNTFNDLTYPMNTQTIITNGRTWSFYEYQLNTLLVHGANVRENAKMNFCRGTQEMQLYEAMDDEGKCVGFNDNVLKHLVRFYTKVPSIQRSVSELQPNLDAKRKHAADYGDEDKRVFLENTFKQISSNRPRHLALPEIYLWEKIYKIDHQTRPMDPRRRYFEVGINPWARTLDQHESKYIPKALRPEGPKSKKKWKKMYYP